MSQRRFWNYMHQRDLAYEADWQYRTSASYVASDGTGSKYADGLTIPGIARHKDTSWNLGSFVRLGNDDNPLRYARALDAGSMDASAKHNKLEMNIAAARNTGDLRAQPSKGPTDLKGTENDAPTHGWAKPVAKSPSSRPGA
jgi:hypothetical protein